MSGELLGAIGGVFPCKEANPEAALKGWTEGTSDNLKNVTLKINPKKLTVRGLHPYTHSACGNPNLPWCRSWLLTVVMQSSGSKGPGRRG